MRATTSPSLIPATMNLRCATSTVGAMPFFLSDLAAAGAFADLGAAWAGRGVRHGAKRNDRDFRRVGVEIAQFPARGARAVLVDGLLAVDVDALVDGRSRAAGGETRCGDCRGESGKNVGMAHGVGSMCTQAYDSAFPPVPVYDFRWMHALRRPPAWPRSRRFTSWRCRPRRARWKLRGARSSTWRSASRTSRRRSRSSPRRSVPLPAAESSTRRRWVCRRCARRLRATMPDHYGVDVAPERVIVTAGSSAALLLVLALIVDRDDRILLPDPPIRATAISSACSKGSRSPFRSGPRRTTS